MQSRQPVTDALAIRLANSGFSIAFHGRTFLHHSPGDAAFSIGSGTGRYRMSHGNFRISDRLQRRMPCSRYLIEQSENQVRILFPESRLQVTFAEESGQLTISFACEDPAVNRLWVRLEGSPQEHIYGCGEQYSRLDLKGSRVPLWVSEQGVGRGHNLVTLAADLHSQAGGKWYTTYFPVPAFVSSDRWFCFCDIRGWAQFDFRRGDSTWLEFWEIPRRVTIGIGADAADTVSRLGRLLGRQPAPPDWVYDGLWLGVQGGRDAIERKLGEAEAARIPVAALWVQDWEGRRETSFGRQLMWNWTFDRRSYPDLPAQIRDLRSRGVRCLGYINPFLAVDGSLYAEASKRGFCVKDAGGEDYRVTVTSFPAALLDLTNPDAMSWIKQVIREQMIGIGMAGWMADYGEYLPPDARLSSGEPAEFAHNRYPVLWARANREAIEEAEKGGELFFFMRSGYLGSTAYSTGYWAGDQMVDFSRHDGLPSVIPAALSLGFVSGGLWHTDIGGFTSLGWIRRTEELFMRWAELAAFTPIMRTHESNRPDTNWQFNSSARTLSHLAAMSSLHAALKPYHLATVRAYTENGLPPIRHPWLQYEKDGEVHRRQDQYLYGRDLMVAPTTRKGSRARPVYLPDDDWVHLWSGKRFSRGRHSIVAPVGRPAVFYRAQSEFRELFSELERFSPETGFDGKR